MRVSSPICLILSDSFAVLQASMFDCFNFDPFSVDMSGLVGHFLWRKPTDIYDAVLVP